MKRTDDYLNKNYDFGFRDVKSTMAIGGIIGAIIATIFIIPWVNFWLSYFGGWIAKIVIGKYLVEGFSFLGITVPLEKIPLIAGVLGWIGSFFKSNTKSSKD